MKTLAAELESLGLENIKTYIQSGNVVFEKAEYKSHVLAKKIEMHIEKRHGFRPRVFLLTGLELESAKGSNPFSKGEADPKTLHLFFLASQPTESAVTKVMALKSSSEEACLVGRVFYLYAPDGIARSKLAAKIEKTLAVPVTARNWRTVNKLCELSKE